MMQQQYQQSLQQQPPPQQQPPQVTNVQARQAPTQPPPPSGVLSMNDNNSIMDAMPVVTPSVIVEPTPEAQSAHDNFYRQLWTNPEGGEGFSASFSVF